jgi:RNA polymerase sigma-70 factor (ECF subfamily)
LEESILSRNRQEPPLSFNEIREEDDCTLMRLLKGGNHDAMAVIVDRYQRLVLSIAIRIVKNATEAQDVVQTVFFDIFRDRGRFDASRGTLKVWVMQYAYNRSINRRHHLEQRQFYSALDVESVPSTPLVPRAAGGYRLSPVEMTRLVRELLATLNEPQQAAIQLVCFEGMTLPEAAEKAGETLAVVRHNYYRGLMRLREALLSDTPANQGAREAERSGECVSLEVKNLKPRTI